MKKSDIESRTESLVLPILDKNSLSLWDVEYVKEGSDMYLRVYIDKEGGVNIDDCVTVSRELDKLLDDNGAEALKDTGEILDQVEQYLCRNVRSALNFMAVADDDAGDKVKEKLESCREENKKLLEQTRDFVYAMAEFLNKQGEKTDTRLLESYRTTLLSTIKEDIL